MNWVKRRVKEFLRPWLRPLLESLARQLRPLLAEEFSRHPLPVSAVPPVQVATSEPAPQQVVQHVHVTQPATADPDTAVKFRLRIVEIARGLAASGDHRVFLPTDTTRPDRPLRVGLFGNIANNAYNAVKCLRRLRHDAELVVEDGWFDNFVMNRPFWEDVEVESSSYEEALTHEPSWTQPEHVRRVAYDPALQQQYQGRYSAVGEVQALYQATFGIKLPEDRALLLAQHMGHWPYLLAMKRYDVVQFSGAAIMMGAFCPRPYVVLSTGSDLFISPFEESDFGLLMRAGYRGASQFIVCETNYPAYLDRLATTGHRTFIPLLIDTDTYCPAENNPVRDDWRRQTGGERFVFGVCRQSWQWKGNDRVIHAFARFASEGHRTSWRLVLQQWGPDIERSRKLIADLGLTDKVLWQPLCSKPLLRQRQQAADVVVDQCVMDGYGTSVLESMSAARPVIVAPVAEDVVGHFADPPPFLGARTTEEIVGRLEEIEMESICRQRGHASREWVEQTHGYQMQATNFWNIYNAAIGRRQEATGPAVSKHRRAA